MIRHIAALAVLLCAASAFSAKSTKLQDDSVWINQGIANAISNGEHQYTVPAGTYILQNPIQIPAGTSNFTLQGAGSSQTILTTPNTALNYCIIVGDWVQLHNNWNLTNRTNYAVSAVGQGSQTIKVAEGTAITTGDYYVLWDTHTEWANNSNQTCVMNHGEVCKVTAYNSSTGTITLDKPTSRSYDSTAELAAINSRICTNITVSGFGMNGLVTGGGSATSALLLGGISDHISTTDMYVTDFFTDAIDFVMARNISISKMNLNNSVATDPGDGYGVTLQRCRYATVMNCTSTNMRHGYIGHAGSTDLTFVNCTATGCDFDLHGMDERRATFTNCTSDGTIQIGNQAWPEGDSSVTINGGSFGGGINACAYAENVTATKTSFACLTVFSELTGVNNPPSTQYPDNFTFNQCSFVNPHNEISESSRFGTATFNGCYFESTNTAWGYIIVFSQMSVKNFTFSSCTFKNDSTRGDVPIQINDPATLFNLTLSNCAVTAEGGSTYAVVFQSKYAGKTTLSNNSFTSVGGSSPTFYENLGTGSVKSTSNSASSQTRK